MSRRLGDTRVLAIGMLLLVLACPVHAEEAARANETGADAATELSRQATDPTASLMSLGFIGTYTGAFHGDQPGLADDRWEFKFQPVIPFTVVGTPNILRLSLPYQLAGRGDEGLSDVTLFDLVVFNQSWGRWGIGPVMTFATADEAPDKFVIGPAIGGVWRVSKALNLGLFNQNVFGGHTAISQLQPIMAYQLGDGWSLSLGDLQFVYDWKAGRWLSAPAGVQLGKVTRIAGQPVRFAINPQYNFIRDDGLEAWKLTFSITVLLPTK